MAPTAEEWIAQFATALGGPTPTAEEVQQVLELASVAAHASERRAAPVACWLAALAGRSPAEARAIAESLSEAAPPPGPARPDR
jgi:hypothetical protein